MKWGSLRTLRRELRLSHVRSLVFTAAGNGRFGLSGFGVVSVVTCCWMLVSGAVGKSSVFGIALFLLR